MKYSFKNDYSEGCHCDILKALADTNYTQQDGYGDDEYSQKARELIQKEMKNEKVDIYFVSGGTQANLIVISSILKPYESVISADNGHINTHEAGSIEAVGHKINTIKSKDGKLRVSDIKQILDEHLEVPHVVKPKMVYISNSTEVGTIYKKDELEELSKFCKKQKLYLFLDGARLGSALCSSQNDVTLHNLTKLVDVFYIGGTKNGALLGEAIVINNNNLKEDFAYNLKQKGALMSKGRVLGLQFMILFQNKLFYKLATHANAMAEKITIALKKQNITFLTNSSTNQIFPILSNDAIKKLEKLYGFYVWQKIDDKNSAIRLVISWNVEESIVDEFIKVLLDLR
ncbi:MAG: aminotransferase class V-fold PLP-dependent enzyme [Epsilonproteobacteria bacterium]|nr:aminotransferase class V-fold PLP-dependent enzyme [Campylobacterota bacterium]